MNKYFRLLYVLYVDVEVINRFEVIINDLVILILFIFLLFLVKKEKIILIVLKIIEFYLYYKYLKEEICFRVDGGIIY